MPTSDIDRSEQLRAERHAVETLYRAFSDQNPDLVDQAVVPDWKDIPLAPGQGPGPEGFRHRGKSAFAPRSPVRIVVRSSASPNGKGREVSDPRVSRARWSPRDHQLASRGLVQPVPPDRPVPRTTTLNETRRIMKAARIHSFGGPEVVEIGDAPAQEPQAREVLVGVEAASVNPLDLKIIAGYMKEFFPVEFPYAPGTDFSGIVQVVGAEVENLKAGDRVVGRSA